MQMRSLSVPLPKEHGAWAMLITPVALGLVALGPSGRSLSAAAGLLLLYAAREPLERLCFARRPGGRGHALLWLTLFLTAGLCALIPVATGPGAPALGLVAALAGACLAAVWRLTAIGQARSLASGLLACVGLTLAGLSVWIAASGGVTPHIWSAGVLLFLFGGGSLFRVKAAARERFDPTFRIVGAALHLAGVALTLALAWVGWLPPLAPLALLPASARALMLAQSEPPAGVRLRVIGLAEMRQSLWFIALGALAYLLA